MNSNKIQKLNNLLATPRKIVIIPHKNPDGDAIGSTLALYHYLQLKGHDALVIAPNDYPQFLKWMPAEDTILKFDTNETVCTQHIKEADYIFTLDFNSLHRIEDMKPLLESVDATFVMIDHHQQPDNYATFMYSDVSMSSTCEMVYNFIVFMNDENIINPSIATCLYAGMMTDTGSFRFPSTTSTTHRIIANLIEKGANNAAIHNAVYDTNSLSKLQLLGCALNNLVYLEEYNTVYITLTKEELEKYNFKKGDTEGFVNYGLSIQGVKLAVIFIENSQEPYIKISLRSKGDFSVNEVSRKYFNGGGHINAAGGRSDMSMEETIAYFKNLLPEYKTQLQS